MEVIRVVVVPVSALFRFPILFDYWCCFVIDVTLLIIGVVL